MRGSACRIDSYRSEWMAFIYWQRVHSNAHLLAKVSFIEKRATYWELQSRKNVAPVRNNRSSENLLPFIVAEFIHMRMFVSKETSSKKIGRNMKESAWQNSHECLFPKKRRRNKSAETRKRVIERIQTFTGILFQTGARNEASFSGIASPPPTL
jgi:hypothetical protein